MTSPTGESDPNTPHPTSNTQHPTPNTQHPTPNMQHPTSNTQHPGPNTQHPTPNIQHPTSNTQHPTPNIQHPTSNTQHPTPNIEVPRAELWAIIGCWMFRSRSMRRMQPGADRASVGHRGLMGGQEARLGQAQDFLGGGAEADRHAG